MARTMAWRFDGRLTIVVHGPKDPTNLEWQQMLTDEAVRGQAVNGRTLIVSYGGGPDGYQRELLTQQMGKKPNPTCIMTRSLVVRALVGALHFFNRGMKVFGLEDRRNAYDFLELSSAERETADRIRKELEALLGPEDTAVASHP